MTESERIEYQAETARLRAANVARVQRDAESMAARDRVVRAAIQALRDTDHGTAIVEYRRVLARRYLDRACEQCGPDADHSNRDHQEVVDMVERANTHDAEPHSRRPSECRFCGKLIASTYVDGRRDQTWHVR